MSELKDLIKSVESAVMESLRLLGFEKKRGVRIKMLNDETFGWVGLNRGDYPAEKEISINPVMGVYNLRVRKLYEELMEREPSKYLIPVTSSPLGYLMPENNYREWFFQHGIEIRPNLKDMIDSIKQYGLPWMEKQTDWKVLVEVAKTNGLQGFREYIPPTIWLAYGEKEKAIEYGEEALSKKKMKGDAKKYVDQYAKFLDKIKQWNTSD